MARMPKSADKRSRRSIESARAVAAKTAIRHLRAQQQQLATTTEPERRGSTEETVNLSVRVPKQLYDVLMRVAGAGGLSGEVRRRLAASLIESPDDPKTYEAVRAIAWVLEHSPGGIGMRWHENANGFHVVVCAVQKILDSFKPEKADEPASEREAGIREGRADAILAIWETYAKGEGRR
jgi:hypothetical protein